MKRIQIADDYYEKFVQDKIGEWSTLALQDFTAAIYGIQEIINSKEVLRSIRKLNH